VLEASASLGPDHGGTPGALYPFSLNERLARITENS
jgi:hypothetical protein